MTRLEQKSGTISGLLLYPLDDEASVLDVNPNPEVFAHFKGKLTVMDDVLVDVDQRLVLPRTVDST